MCSGDSCSLSLMPKNLIFFLLLKHSCLMTLRSNSSSLTILSVVAFSIVAVAVACSFKERTWAKSMAVDKEVPLGSHYKIARKQ